MSKGSQKKRPVDPDLQESLREAISGPVTEEDRTNRARDQRDEARDQRDEARVPWFLSQGVGASEAPVIAGPASSEEWRPGSFVFHSGSSQAGDVLCNSQRPGSLIPVAPVLVDGCYVLSRQYGEDPMSYTYARREAVDCVILDGPR